MSEARHTPGQWTMTTGEVGYDINSEGTPWKAVADCKPNNLGTADVDDAEAKANARMVAAAPDMLAACQCAVSALTQNATFPADIRMAVSVLQNAIRKATGK